MRDCYADECVDAQIRFDHDRGEDYRVAKEGGG